MAADAGPTQTFKDGRASLRETAKWLVSGIATAATLIGGSAVFSQLGSLPFLHPRFLFAIAAVFIATAFLWKPFKAAVQVLKSETQGLREFIAAAEKAEQGPVQDEAERQKAEAFKRANTKLKGLVKECDRLRQIIFADPNPTPAPATAKAQEQLEGLTPLELFCLETCSSTLVTVRFDALVDALWRFGGMSLIFFALFAWAANPPKDAAKTFDPPMDISRVLALDGPTLKASGVEPACYGAGAALVAISGADPGAKTAILVPPRPTPKGCKLRKVELADNRIIRVD